LINLVTSQGLAIIIAIVLNETRAKRFKKVSQSYILMAEVPKMHCYGILSEVPPHLLPIFLKLRRIPLTQEILLKENLAMHHKEAPDAIEREDKVWKDEKLPKKDEQE
jgi:hypothetical protein